MAILDSPLAAGLALAGSLVLLRLFTRSSALHPPGPKKLPIVGNLLDMPKEQEWVKFSEWAEQYGDLVNVSVFGQQFLIINSQKMAEAILGGKSSIYSDRPVLQMGGELVGYKDALGLLRYGPRLRNYRRMFHQVIGTPAALSRFHHIRQAETHRFLQNLLAKPDELLSHIRRTVGAGILILSHGYQVQEENDRFITLGNMALEQFSLSVSPGVFLVNLVPAHWFPGAGFKKTAKEWRKVAYDTVEEPFEFVKREMAEGRAKPSMTSELLQNEETLSAKEIFDIKWATASMYGGAFETSVAMLSGFFKAMVLYPEVQAKAQAEIDNVIGSNRLPTIQDRDSLPFVSAVAMESLRWHVTAPTGLPHRLMEDDVHDGYLIQKGTLVMPNIWLMSHDPRNYKNPSTFNPARFIKTDSHEPELDPREIAFGFGRRVCPGRLLADESMFLTCAMTLAVFNITPHMKDGKPVMPDVRQSTGAISHPSPFKCAITPRSSKALALINENPTFE